MGRLPAATEAHNVLIDPKQPQRVYAAGGTGLYRSDDAGETWQSVVQGLPAGGVVALALDPRQPQRLYAATPAGALYLSEDGATTWQALTGTAPNATK